MAILVTGGAGYIGSHTCVELLNAGYKVVVVDNLSNSKIESLARVKAITGKDVVFYKMDLLDRVRLETVFVENGIDAVIHFAGEKMVGEFVKEPLWYYHNDLFSTLILCEVMKKYNVKNLIFSSSSTVYGMPAQAPLNEECLLGATKPYGRTKQMIEEILRDLHVSDHEWSVALLRYFNPIGAHKSGLIGEASNGIPNNLLQYISQVAVGKLNELNVFGNDYPTPDGTGVRDYIHVVDLAIGHLRALEKILPTNGVEPYNLSTGNGYSVLEIVGAFEKTSGRNIPYKITARRPGDIGVCYANPTKAKVELGWIAQRGIEEMCEDSWRWQFSKPNGYVEEEEKLISTGIQKG